jgi:hypothetical protein
MLKDTRINAVNIGLMLFSCAAAFIMPFEVFLFAYAFMGPLHYLTEISWLHDRQYFAKGKYDYLVLVVIGLFIALEYFAYRYSFWPFNNEENSAMARDWSLGDKLLFLAFFGAIIMAFVKNIYLKILALLLIFFISNGAFVPKTEDSQTSNLEYIFSAFVPTLIHVYVFTGFFILYGALKSRSQSGIISFFIFIICPLLLFALFRDKTFVPVTQYGMSAFGNTSTPDGFFDLNQGIMAHFFNPAEIAKNTPGINITKDNDASIWAALIYKSQTGILIMRFIAFAYMYHYLNWFSKTEIIRWHKVPKMRFVAVIILWIFSLVVYAIDYAKGLQWLFFLSFCHVLLEFPLNFKSIVGIGSELGSIAKSGFKPKQHAPVPKRS